MTMYNNQKIILFVSPPAPFLEEPAYVPHLGLLYLSASLKQTKWPKEEQTPAPHYLELAHLEETHARKTFNDVVERLNPACIAFTATTPQYEFVTSLSTQIHEKYPNIRRLIGGAHATNYADAVVDNKNAFDHVFIGEAETEIVKFWNHFNSGLNNTVRKYECEVALDVNQIPGPDWDISGLSLDLYSCVLDGKKALPILTSRGCNYNCAFCEKKPKGPRREIDLKHVKAELDKLRKLNIQAAVIYDCCLVLNKKRARDLKGVFCNGSSGECANSAFPWRGFLRTDVASDEMLSILKDSGCRELGFGVESGSDDILRRIKKSPCSRSINTDAIRACRRTGIRSKAFLMVGLPGETKRTIDQTIGWTLEAEPDSIDVSLYMPFKGSEIAMSPNHYGLQVIDDPTGSRNMFYKGSATQRYQSFVATSMLPWKRGLSRDQVVDQFQRLREFRQRYNERTSLRHNNELDENAHGDAIESYKTLADLVVREGELIWKQIGLFIQTNSILLIALGLITRLNTPGPLVRLVAGLGVSSSIVWYFIYRKSWHNQKIYHYLARKQELALRFTAYAFSEGAMIRHGKEVNDFTEKTWHLNRLDRIPISQWIYIWAAAFLLFWICVGLAPSLFPAWLQTGAVTIP